MMLAAAVAALALASPFPGIAHATLHGLSHRSSHGVAHRSLHGQDDGEPEIQLHNVQLQNCPLACDYATSDTSTWTTYHSFDELSLCNDTVLFTINVHANTVDPHIKACLTSPGGPQMQAGAFYGLLQNNVTTNPSPEMVPELVVSEGKMVTSQDGACGASPQKSTLTLETRWSGQGNADADKASYRGTVSDVLSQLAKYFRNSASCGRDLMFARSSANAVVGAFAGGDILKSSVADLIEAHTESIIQGTIPALYGMQTTGAAAQNGSKTQAQFDTRLGFFADLTGNVSSVQGFLADYINNFGEGVDLQDLEGGQAPVLTFVTILGSPVVSNATTSGRSVQPRALCRDIQVIKDDSCASLASRCGISGSDFTKYNSKTSNMCATLKPKQYVCCSQGDLPDHTPQPSGDGTCFTYEVKADDGCWSIADSFGIDTQRIEDVNKKTWGFAGCSRLQQKAIICLSKGNPPMPAQDPSIICGPQVIGTQRPANWDDIAKLNPCPLNACCDVWGQCGTTEEFCTRSDVDDEHIGTAKPNTNGCISNCGTNITNNNAGPAQFARVGYFEAFNTERSCLNMDITQMDTDTYTHIHFAFATIGRDYRVAMADGVKEQFDKMVNMDTTAKKILSFGGWSFSTDHDTSPIFATGVSDANRELFATNVVQFLKDNKLDGLDFDWEYPGATDIEGSVPGSPSDGLNYLKFLKSVKGKMPSGKTVSIALPASYWYLKGFPVKLMSAVVDYFIYMTYDLHGQWDYGSKWSNPGCKTGNCLRSHVNKTETQTALSMVTKAGVPSNKIMVGVSSYGRSFKMVDSSCTGVMCKFTGSPKVSNAEPGMCTATSGYIADAEMQALIEANELDGSGGVKTWFDDASDSNIMTWNGNWVAYMDSFTKYTRIQWVKKLNFGGTTDWAVDLQEFQGSVDDGDGEDNADIDNEHDEDCIQEYANLDALVADINNVASVCAAEYAIGTMATLLDETLKKYDEIKNDYDGKFGYYAGYIDELVNPQLENWMNNFFVGEENKTGLGNKYFDCKYEKKGNKYSGPCPVPYSLMRKDSWDDPEYGYESWEIEYTLRDKDGYEKALGKDLGISADWIVFKDTDTYPECEGAPDDCTEVHQWHRKDYPRKKDKISVPDPKKIMEDALPTIQALRTQMSQAVMMLGFSLYDSGSDGKDAIYALATPVQMLAQAVDTMSQVKDIGGKISAQKKKETILLIVSLILMIVPFVSELGFAVAGLSNLARLAFVAGEVANGAQSIYDIIDDPESAPFAVMGILAGAAGKTGKLEKTFADASAARKVLTDASAMGKRFKEIDDKYQTVMGRCSL